MSANVLDMPSVWPEEMNRTIEMTIDGTTTGTEVERDRSEETLRTAITAFLDTHFLWELEDLVAELTQETPGRS